jgi:hypothetical protein
MKENFPFWQLSGPAGFTEKGNMNDPKYQRLVETNWRRALTQEEKAHLDSLLAGKPGAQADWQTEAVLTNALRRLPEVPAASNFTAQVLRAVQAEQARATHGSLRWPNWLGRLWPRVAWAAVVLALGTTSLQTYRHFSRVRIVQDLASIPVVPRIPSSEVLEDFDAIQEFSHLASAPSGVQTISDEALLAALE